MPDGKYLLFQVPPTVTLFPTGRGRRPSSACASSVPLSLWLDPAAHPAGFFLPCFTPTSLFYSPASLAACGGGEWRAMSRPISRIPVSWACRKFLWLTCCWPQRWKFRSRC